MSPPHLPLIVALLYVFTVAMVTSAPLANTQEQLVALDQHDNNVDRAKRADEEILFGNLQNQPRTVAKKWAPGDSHEIVADRLVDASQGQGEVDQGSEVTVHKEEPVTKEMKARIEESQQAGVGASLYPQELESSAQSIVESVMSGGNAMHESGEKQDDLESEEEENPKNQPAAQAEVAAETTGNADDAQGTSSTGGETLPIETPEEDEVGDVENGEATSEDNEEKDLQEISSENDSAETGTGSSEEANQEPQSDQSGQDSYNNVYESYNNPNDLFYNYLNYYRPYQGNLQQPTINPYYLARRRRSSAIAHLAKSRRAHRIKRDLLDDGLYNLYDPPSLTYPSLTVDDALPLSDPSDYVPLTDDEAAILYSRLLDYLEDALAAEEEAGEESAYNESVNDDVIPYEPEFLPDDEEEFQDTPYMGDAYSPEIPSPYDDGYPYGPVDLDTYNKYSKRGMMSYFPSYPAPEKRYFFPASDEPGTHWGAFVPEKRDYGESIQRLQRLAMALSDNPSPYYREMVEDYKRK